MKFIIKSKYRKKPTDIAQRNDNIFLRSFRLDCRHRDRKERKMTANMSHMQVNRTREKIEILFFLTYRHKHHKYFFLLRTVKKNETRILSQRIVT
jgi:hypothetical protein